MGRRRLRLRHLNLSFTFGFLFRYYILLGNSNCRVLLFDLHFLCCRTGAQRFDYSEGSRTCRIFRGKALLRFFLGKPKQFVVGGGEVTFLVQIANHQLGCAIDVFVDVQRSELPQQVVRKSAGLGKEVLEGRLLAVLHFNRGAQAGVEVFGEEGAEVNLLKGIFFFRCRDRLLLLGRGAIAFHLLFASRHFIEKRNGAVQFFENRILSQLGIDHVGQLKLVERQDTDHLHEAGGQNLLLGNFEV